MAGGFFSGGSSDAVNASVAEAEAAAREAEAARDEINDKFVEYAGQTEEGDYTVPNADDALETKFLRQDGTWNIPPAGTDGATDLSELTDVDSSLSPTDNQILQYNATTSQFEAADPAAASELVGTAPITVGGGAISLDDLGVTTAKLGADSVTNAKIADNAVQQANIATGSIDSTRLLNDAVTTDKILNNAVTTAKIAAGAVDNAQIADGAVDTDQIAADAVVGSKIADLTVTGGKLASGSITEPKLSSTNTPTAGQVLSGNIDGTFTWVDQSGGGGTDNITASNGLARTGNDIAVVTTGLTSTQIADDAIITSKITTGAVTSNEIADATIVDGDIADTTITGDKLVNATITSTQLATDAVTTVKIEDGAVTTDKINDAAVDETKLDVSNTGVAGQVLSADGDGTFTWVANGSGGDAYTADEDTLTLSAGNQFSINALGVDTAELAANAVTSAKIMDNNVGADQLNVTGDGSAGQTLASDGDGSFTWTDSNTLRGLTDTNIPASITNRRFLEYNTSTNLWDARAATEFLNLAELFDVDITNVADNQFLRYNSTDDRWENESITIPADLSFTSPLSRSGSTVSIPDLSITGSKIDNGTLTAAKLTDSTVTVEKMAANSVNTSQLVNTSVTAAKIADGAVTASKIPNNELTAVQLATDSVTSFKIQAGAVIAGKIADNVVGADELNVSGDGTSGQFLTSDGDGTFSWTTSSGGVTYTAGNGLDLSVGNEFSIAALGVDTAELADNAITEGKIADAAVGSGKIANGAVSTADIADNAVTNDKIPDNGIHGDKITDATISASEIGPSAVTTAKIMDAAVTNAKIGTDVVISTLSDVDTSGVNNGQILSWDGSNWTPINNNGGGTDNSRLVITTSPVELNSGDPEQAVTVTLSIGSPLTGETISGQSVTVTDPTGHAVTATGSGNDWSFQGSGDVTGNYVIRASATFTISGVGSVHQAIRQFTVRQTNSNWYQAVTATEPTAVSSMTNQGGFDSPETATFERTDAAEFAYVALPTGNYTFHAGLLFATITDLGVIDTNYTLYRIDDFAQVPVGMNRIITITEA